MAATNTIRLIDAAAAGHRPDHDEALGLVDAPLDPLMEAAEALTVAGFGQSVSYSRKVFIPLTQLCRDVCHYCTFAKAPRRLARPYMSPEEVLAIARAGQAQGCKEALFTLGDKPELRYTRGAPRARVQGSGHDARIPRTDGRARVPRDWTAAASQSRE